jgi:anti-sigma B factor antagonist
MLADSSDSSTGLVVLAVSGEVDSVTAPDLRAALYTILNGPACKRLVVDLAGVTFLASAGIAALLEAREVAESREIKLRLTGTSANRAARRPLEVTGMAKHLASDDEQDELGQP